MDLLNILTLYMSMLYATSMQTAPDNLITPEPVPTQTSFVVETELPTDVPTETPFFTPGPTAVPLPDFTPNKSYNQLNLSDKGDEVKKLQATLSKYGYYNGAIDGKYGYQTLEAVRIFQKLQSLSADGIAGRQTLTVLYESKNIVNLIDLNSTIIPISLGLETPAPTFVPSAETDTSKHEYPDEPLLKETAVPEPTSTVDLLSFNKGGNNFVLDVSTLKLVDKDNKEIANKLPVYSINMEADGYAISLETVLNYLNFDFKKSSENNELFYKWKKDNTDFTVKLDPSKKMFEAYYLFNDNEYVFDTFSVDDNYFIKLFDLPLLFNINFDIDLNNKTIKLGN